MALVVIGGIAAGLSAAARARRLDPRLEIVVLEKGPVVSYGACGLPYFVEGRVRESSQLIVYTPEYFRKERNIDVRTARAWCRHLHPRREVTLEDGARMRYDRLVLATGARCDSRGIAGADQPHVFTLHTLDDAERHAPVPDGEAARRAVVIGAGYIGVEAADALRRQGLEVTFWSGRRCALARRCGVHSGGPQQLEMHRVELRCEVAVESIEAGRVGDVACDMVASLLVQVKGGSRAT